MIAEMLQEPLLRDLDVDSSDRIALHKKILEKKPLMRGVCREIYALCADLDKQLFSASGTRIELGAGVSFIKEFFSDVIVSDVVPAPHLDKIIDAQAMSDVPDNSVAAFYGIHCFHHFPAPRKFFSELNRTLKPGGGCILVEPYFGAAARLVYPRLFKSERFDMDQVSWDGGEAGVMSDANQALSYIVFYRDRLIFERENPALEICYSDQLTNYLRYVLSGGLNFRSLVPNGSDSALKLVERLIKPLRSFLALHHVTVLRKRS